MSNKKAFDSLLGQFENIDDLIDRFNSLTDSYRLFVGAAEELTRTPSANQKIIYDAMVRTAFLGNILDQFLIAIQLAIISELFCSEDDDLNIPNPFM